MNEVLKVSEQLYRSYKLSGKWDNVPEKEKLREQAQEILRENALEHSPIQPDAWEIVFHFARIIFRYPSYSELKKAWMSSECQDIIFARKNAERKKAVTDISEYQYQNIRRDLYERASKGYFCAQDEYERFGISAKEAFELQQDFIAKTRLERGVR